jgi:plastocyanin
VVAAAVGCSDGRTASEGDRPANPTSSSAPLARIIPKNTAAGGCASHLPGMVMTEDESIIEFTTDRICPAYVTILTGTTVTWRNLAGAPETVTLTTEDGTVVTEQLLQPGAEYKYRFDVAGRTIYRVASIPTFTGIIEVQD